MEVHENLTLFRKWKQQQQNGWKKTILAVIFIS